MNWKFWKKAKDIIKNEKSMAIETKYVYPCTDDNCLVRVACTKPCDRIEMDDDKLMDIFLKLNACPDCGSPKFKEGPSGGMATNVQCEGCTHHFNFALPLFINRIHITNGRFV